MDSTKRTLLFGAPEVSSAITRLVDSISHDFGEELPETAFLGIQYKGAHLAERIVNDLSRLHGVTPLLGTLDISMYRDDIGLRKTLPVIKETSIPFDVNGRVIVLVDDVLSTGRTIRAALDAINDYGRPKLIRLAVIVDRGGQEFPIKADYIALASAVPADRRILLHLKGFDDEDAIFTTAKDTGA
jgi:pyrimidine operon attenuation protein/uracil phosphoribosyltransferase